MKPKIIIVDTDEIIGNKRHTKKAGSADGPSAIDVLSMLSAVVKRGGPCDQSIVDGEFYPSISTPKEEDFTIFWLLETEITPEIHITPDMWKSFNRKEIRNYLTTTYPKVIKATAARGYTVQSLKQAVKALHFTMQIRLNDAAYKEAMDKYSAEQEVIRDNFKKALFAEFGVAGKDKAQDIFEKAWKIGGGQNLDLKGVYICFKELTSLIS